MGFTTALGVERSPLPICLAGEDFLSVGPDVCLALEGGEGMTDWVEMTGIDGAEDTGIMGCSLGGWPYRVEFCDCGMATGLGIMLI